MQELPQTELVRPICRRVETVTEGRHVLSRLDAALEAAQGATGRPGQSYIDFPKDLLDEKLRGSDQERRFLDRHDTQRPVASDVALNSAATLAARAMRPLVISGGGANGSGGALESFLDATGALLLETGDSRGWVRSDHPAHIPAMRSRAMREADLVITVGRRLDYQLAYGSPAVFAPDATFLRIGNTFEELSENRRGDVEVRGEVRSTLERVARIVSEGPTSVDKGWTGLLRRENAARVERLRATMVTAQAAPDGKMHPYCLLAAVNNLIDDDTIIVADGGDILSFARVGLNVSTYLDCGALGCLGVGIPFAVAASATQPDRRVIAVIGDGAVGFTIAELDTARRRNSNVVFVVANNAAWNIERTDQLERYGGNLVGVDLPDCRYDLVARGFGLYAERVDEVSTLNGALQRCSEHAPALLDVVISRDVRSPDTASGLATVPLRHALRTWDEAEAGRIE